MRHSFMPPDPGDRIIDEAGAWFAKRHVHAPEVEDAFRAWLDADPAHARAYDAIEAVWRDMAPPPTPSSLSRRTVLGGTAAACLLGGATWLNGGPEPFLRLAADRATGSGQQAEHALPDGTRIWLDAASALDNGPGPRAARLLAGQALFELVGQDRPFTVTTRDGHITMRQGRLLVKRMRDSSRAIVLAGRARIEVPGRPGLDLSAPRGSGFDAAGIGPPTAWNAEETLAWRTAQLLYRDAALGEVLDDLARHAGLHVVASDGAAALRVTAALDATALDPSLATLSRSLPVRLTRLPGMIFARGV